jgi:hypothetical protein
MDQKISRLFKNIPELEPTATLQSAVFRAIELKNNRRDRRRKFFAHGGLAVSFVATIFAAWTLGGSLLKSDFWSIASLIFSDIEIVATNWQNFSLSLLENFPTVSLVGILVPVAALLLFIGLDLEFIGKHNQHHKYI